MSSAMDKALIAMSLEDEDVPFVMPDLPEYRSNRKKYEELDWSVTQPWLSENGKTNPTRDATEMAKARKS